MKPVAITIVSRVLPTGFVENQMERFYNGMKWLSVKVKLFYSTGKSSCQVLIVWAERGAVKNQSVEQSIEDF